MQFALLRKLREIRQPFSDLDHRKWNSQILQQIAQNLLNLPIFNASHAKFASSASIPIYSKSCKICEIRPHSPRITRNSHILLTYSTFISGTCTRRELSGIPANYADSARFAHTAHESCEFHTLCTIIKIYVIDFQISDHRQRTQEIGANQQDSAQFAHLLRELRKFCAFCSKLIHV